MQSRRITSASGFRPVALTYERVGRVGVWVAMCGATSTVPTLPTQQITASYSWYWSNGTWYPFVATYDPAIPRMSYTVAGKSCYFDLPAHRPPHALALMAVANTYDGAGVALRNLEITGAGIGSPFVPIPDPDGGPWPWTLQAVRAGTNDLKLVAVDDAPIAGGAEIRGEIRWSWGANVPRDSHVAAEIKIGDWSLAIPDDPRRHRRMKVYGPELIHLAERVRDRRRAGAYGYGDDEENQP